jgi:uncharacterized protein YqgC (DUF456 family)
MEITIILLWIAAVIFISAGIIGLIIPAVPGPSLLLIGLICAAWAEGFEYIGWGTVTVLILLTGGAFLIDFVAGALGAKRSGASKQATYGALLGAVVGIFFGLVGAFIGPFIGAFVAELLVRRQAKQATEVGVMTLIGVVIGAAAKVAIGFTMIGLYIIIRFF